MTQKRRRKESLGSLRLFMLLVTARAIANLAMDPATAQQSVTQIRQSSDACDPNDPSLPESS
ncbi:MAG: hypothetical protein RLY14_3476, partial [Planctomycetota bacterium]